MPRPTTPRLALAAAFAAVATVAAVAASATPAAARPLVTSVYMVGDELSPSHRDLAFTRIARAGATRVRLAVYWAEVAPGGRPVTWDPRNPADPHYNWSAIDAHVRGAVARGLQPYLNILSAPVWAQTGTPETPPRSHRPQPSDLADFATAAARRYSGAFAGLPRVRFWLVWNEPNLVFYLTPQLEAGQPVSPHWYRGMVNAFADAVRAVRADNVVIAGATAPFTSRTGDRALWGVSPLVFMRELLCLTPQLTRKCNDTVRFDIWSHHPYTSGGPTRKAFRQDDVSLGNLPEMLAVLRAGERLRTIVPRARPVDFWVTEFSWDTNPPDPGGVPAALHARWVAEALYRMWQNQVSQVTWFTLRDEPMATSWIQSGLFYRAAMTMQRDRPKPAHQAFRFPFVAFAEGNRRVLVWGRTPAGRRGNVYVEQSFRGGWRHVATIPTNQHGIFTRRIQGAQTGSLRARLLGTQDRARPFSLRVPPDRFFNPFGTVPD